MSQKNNGDIYRYIFQLGNLIRKYRREGKLQSVPPPTIYGYLSFLRLADAMPHMSFQQIAIATMLGNASMDDRKYVTGLFNEIFGVRSASDDDPTVGGNLY